jgi:galactose mutarotase-like enzyme
MSIVENDFLKVTFRTKGAELTSVFDKANRIEHLWQGDPQVWPWHAPNLFPVVGGCVNNEIHVNGKAYRMERHGFARQSEFILLSATANQALFALPFSEQTLAVYPYQFNFQIEYTLQGKQLTITYRVRNEGDQPQYFSVGAHPAFNVPFFPGEDYADYYLEFPVVEKLERHLLSKDGYFNGQTERVSTEGAKLLLTKDLFNQDALVFKDLQSRQVTLRSVTHKHSLTVDYPDFEYLGVWAKPGAPFVCIEPWLGCADTEGKAVDIREKEAIQAVNPGAVFEASFSITVQ